MVHITCLAHDAMHRVTEEICDKFSGVNYYSRLGIVVMQRQTLQLWQYMTDTQYLKENNLLLFRIKQSMKSAYT